MKYSINDIIGDEIDGKPLDGLYLDRNDLVRKTSHNGRNPHKFGKVYTKKRNDKEY